MSNLFSLRGSTALVTGGFSGLGRHFCATLLKAGADVAIAGRRIEHGHKEAQALQEWADEQGAGGRVLAFALDVTRRESVEACLREVHERLGQATILVNNAGVATTTPVLETTDADWNAVLDVNLTGAWRVAQVFAQGLVATGSPGRVVNVGSILGLRVAQQVPAYAASKAGLLHLTRALAIELARHRIRVNALAPGYFQTDLNQALFASEAGQALVRRIPDRRLGDLSELDGPLLLLASEACSFMNGAVLTVDGGHSINSL
jgi:2-deoxy-D-gluconate 3-dehydrogenase